MSPTWFINVLGIILSGVGASLLAYHIFSFKSKYSPGTLGHDFDKADYEDKNETRTKIALFLIPIGAGLQLLAQFLD